MEFKTNIFGILSPRDVILETERALLITDLGHFCLASQSLSHKWVGRGHWQHQELGRWCLPLQDWTERSPSLQVLMSLPGGSVSALCPVALAFLRSCPLLMALSCSVPVLCCPRLSSDEDCHLPFVSCNMSPPGVVVGVSGFAEGKMRRQYLIVAVANCSHANV